MPDSAKSELQNRYAATVMRIQSACHRANRDPGDVTLIAVSKTFPVDIVQDLHALGHRDFGENKVQELLQKKAHLDDLGGYEDIRWHLIGHLQRNKVRHVLGATHLFHGLDSERLAREINTRAAATGNPVDCLMQVNISTEDSKYGVPLTDVDSHVKLLHSFEYIRLLGYMGMARPSEDEQSVVDEFNVLRELAENHRDIIPEAIISMGMSQDFELAISAGATHVRVGSAIFGSRTYS